MSDFSKVPKVDDQKKITQEMNLRIKNRANKMNWIKVLQKGLEAGIPAALASAGLSQDASVAIGTAIAGFIFGALKNYLKHRNK